MVAKAVLAAFKIFPPPLDTNVFLDLLSPSPTAPSQKEPSPISINLSFRVRKVCEWETLGLFAAFILVPLNEVEMSWEVTSFDGVLGETFSSSKSQEKALVVDGVIHGVIGSNWSKILSRRAMT